MAEIKDESISTKNLEKKKMILKDVRERYPGFFIDSTDKTDSPSCNCALLLPFRRHPFVRVLLSFDSTKSTPSLKESAFMRFPSNKSFSQTVS